MSTTHTNTIYLIRHGENIANITKEFSYKLVDYPLTPKGELQAEQTADFFRGRHIDAIYASPLKRAKQTAEIIARPLGLPVQIMEEFREVNVGDLEKRPPTVESWREHDRIIAQWVNGHPEVRFPGGENFLELIARVKRGLLAVTRDRVDQQIIIVGHGGIFTAAVMELCQNAAPGEKTYGDWHNCAITEVELTTRGEELSGQMHCWATYEHLSGEAAQLVPGPMQYETKA